MLEFVLFEEPGREIQVRRAVAEQQVATLEARIERKHLAAEGLLRLSARGLEAESLGALWTVATEEVVSAFGAQTALLLRLDDARPDGVEVCVSSGTARPSETELAALTQTVRRALAAGEGVVVGDWLPTIAGSPTAVLLVCGFRDRQEAATSYALVAGVSAAGRTGSSGVDAAIAPSYCAFVAHVAALQQHVRVALEVRTAAEKMQRLADVASRTSNGVVIADRAGRIEWVNDGFERLSGYSLAESVGKFPGELLAGPETDVEARRIMREAVAAHLPFDVEVSNYAKSGRQYRVTIESRVTHDERGEPSGFIGIQTDVTKQRIAARREALAQRVAGLLLTSNSLDGASEQLVGALVEELGVPIAQAWAVRPGHATLAYLAGSAAPATGSAGAQFLVATRRVEFRAGAYGTAGVGLPGAVWASGKVSLLDAFEAGGAASFLRGSRAAAAGLHTFGAAPILGPNGVLGVLEIGVERGHLLTDALPSILARVAEQVAAFMLHDLSRRAFRSVFDQSPDGLLLVDENGRVRAANVRADALFGACAGRSVDDVLEGGEALVHKAIELQERDGVAGAAALYHRNAQGQNGQEFSAEVSVAATHTAQARGAILAVRDLTDRHAMEGALLDSLREKETLLKEIHHRVKNNLQIISSLLMLQVDEMPSARARELLAESVHRVRSMALIHQQLYGAESLARIDLASYASQLAESLRGALAPMSHLRLDASAVEVTIEHAVPVGLILNELLTNALKYGVLPRAARSQEPDVVVELKLDGRMIVLTVRDFGKGLPDQFDITRTTSLGLQLVRTLARQLRGTIEAASDGGATFTLSFPKSEPHPSHLPASA